MRKQSYTCRMCLSVLLQPWISGARERSVSGPAHFGIAASNRSTAGTGSALVEGISDAEVQAGRDAFMGEGLGIGAGAIFCGVTVLPYEGWAAIRLVS